MSDATVGTRPLPSPRRRVLVVDDSAFMRRVVRDLIVATDEFDVIATARDGEEAIRLVHALDPDIVTLDIAMPGLDGLDVLGYIMSESPRPVVMLSAADRVGAGAGAVADTSATLRALELGAVEFVRKPSGPISLDLARVGDRLLDALRAAAASNLDGVQVLARLGPRAPSASPAATGRLAGTRSDAPSHVIVVAASTGGPAALAQIIPALPRELDAAVVVVQHMPRGFTAGLADRLHGLSALPVLEAHDGVPLTNGVVHIAPGGVHLRLQRTVGGVHCLLDDGPTVWGVRPAADPLFASAADAFGAAVTAVVCTGMGRDGADGARLVRRAGGRVVVQDPRAAVIDGMPRSAIAAAGADAIVATHAIAPAIVHLLTDAPRRAPDGVGAAA